MDSDQLTFTDRRRPGSAQGPGRLLTADEVAELLGVTKAWVYEQSRLGRIPTVTLGRFRRYRLEAILEWIEQIEEGRRAA